jgi:hypothetical protein
MIEKRGLLRVFLIHVRVATIFLFERKRKAKIVRRGREKFSSENLFVTTIKTYEKAPSYVIAKSRQKLKIKTG